MSEKIKTGTIIPIGDGSVGKSALTKILFAKMQHRELTDDDILQILGSTNKSTNIEMEFITDYKEVNGENIKVSMQYYVFPGQVQKESSRTVTFNEILNIFEFMPALKNVQVLLLVYDVTRFYTLQSLDSWLTVAIEKNWVNAKSSVLLVANKCDLELPKTEYTDQLINGIYTIMQNNHIEIPKENIQSINTSCKSLEGIDALHNAILSHIAQY